MSEENISVVKYLEGSEELMEYFYECKLEDKQPNYSEFCRKHLNGETREGISFDSIKIKRKDLTEFIRTKYKLWLKLNK